MISFKEIEKDGIREAAESLGASGEALSAIFEIVGDYGDMIDGDGDTGVAICITHGCLAIRLFDMGRYLFVFPFELTDEADILAAADEIRAYAVKEELPLDMIDIPAELLGEVAGIFSHCELDAEDGDRTSFMLRAKNECQLMRELPVKIDGELRLDAIGDADVTDYAKLCRSEELNKYWGYDYREEATSLEDDYFYRAAKEELSRGNAVSLAVRWRGKFIGEAVIYHFDFTGGAEIAFRILPEYHGRGLGTRTISLLFLAARELGLFNLCAEVMTENEPSVRLLDKHMSRTGEADGIIRYRTAL